MSELPPPKVWSPLVSRRRGIGLGAVFAAVGAVALGAGAYALGSDPEVAVLVFVMAFTAAFAVVLLGWRFLEWYEDLMNRSWGRPPEE